MSNTIIDDDISFTSDSSRRCKAKRLSTASYRTLVLVPIKDC